MAIQFKSQEAWRGPGRPETLIPDEIVEALEHTLAFDLVAEDVADENDPETWQAIRLMQLYCRRKHMKLDFQFFDRDGKTWLRFKMRKPRPYNRQVVTPLGRYRR